MGSRLLRSVFLVRMLLHAEDVSDHSDVQRVLLMSPSLSSSPRDEFLRPPLDSPPQPHGAVDNTGHEHERERVWSSPDSSARRRAVNWLDEDFGIGASHQTSLHTTPTRARRYGYGGTASNATSRDTSRVGERGPGGDRSRSRSQSRDPFT